MHVYHHCMITSPMFIEPQQIMLPCGQAHAYTYTFSCWSQMGSSYYSHDHGSGCMQPSMQVHTVLEALPKIAVYRPGNDFKVTVSACST